MKLNDEYSDELWGLLVEDHCRQSPSDFMNKWPQWLFAESVRVPVQKRRGKPCAAWFETDSNERLNEMKGPKTPVYIDYSCTNGSKRIMRDQISVRLANRIWSIWWRFTLRGTSRVRWSPD